jgi:hypothetical protein
LNTVFSEEQKMNAPFRLLKLSMISLPILLGAAWCVSNANDFFGGDYGYPVDDRASTAAEGYARGLSDVIRSQGAANLLNSQAAINATEAEKKSIENREQWTSTYFQMRKENREARAAESGPRSSAEDLVRYAQMGKPKILGSNELDKVSGKIFWPIALTTDEYSDSRKQLDDIFARRAKYGDISMGELMNVVNITNQMIEQLKSQIKNIPGMEYSKAKAFLVSLAYEVQRSS